MDKPSFREEIIDCASSFILILAKLTQRLSVLLVERSSHFTTLIDVEESVFPLMHILFTHT